MGVTSNPVKATHNTNTHIIEDSCILPDSLGMWNLFIVVVDQTGSHNINETKRTSSGRYFARNMFL